MTVLELQVPSAADGPEAHADWLELKALSAADGSSSLQDLVQAIRRSGTIEALGPDDEDDEPAIGLDRGAERSQSVGEDALGEIADRLTSCGEQPTSYPFRVGERHIELRTEVQKSVYLFLLLLSRFGRACGPAGVDGARLFEQVCTEAAAAYLGGERCRARRLHFGSPRKKTPRGFRDAVDDLCRKTGEGQGCRQDRSKLRDQKDARLDLVVWVPFPDARLGKLLVYGQCATGKGWRDKLTHLQPETFCGKWLIDQPVVPPVRLFCVPFRIERALWTDAARDGGILLDRCRIAHLSPALDKDLVQTCSRWTAHVRRRCLSS